MAEELETLLDDKGEEQKVPLSRVNELSKKFKTAETSLTEKTEALKVSDEKLKASEREKDFYASFADTVSEYPNAKDHKDEIKTKVLAGYSVEDATVAVLNKAGKLSTTKTVERVSPAGGSSSNPPIRGGEKTIATMTRDEKRAALLEAEARGDISLS